MYLQHVEDKPADDVPETEHEINTVTETSTADDFNPDFDPDDEANPDNDGLEIEPDDEDDELEEDETND
jgi:hypothetical protein